MQLQAVQEDVDVEAGDVVTHKDIGINRLEPGKEVGKEGALPGQGTTRALGASKAKQRSSAPGVIRDPLEAPVSGGKGSRGEQESRTTFLTRFGC